MADNLFLPQGITKFVDVKVEFKDDEMIRFLRDILGRVQTLEANVKKLEERIVELEESNP